MIKSGIQVTAFDAIKVYLPYSFFYLFDLDCLEETSDEIKCTVCVYSFWSPLVAAVWNVVARATRRL
jgi:hypothetical protein